MKSLRFKHFTLALLALASPVIAQEKPATEAEKTAQDRAKAYAAAFNQADVGKLGALYAEDVQYTADDGTTEVGREAVVKGLETFFKKNKGAKLVLNVESARFITPEVLAEKGLATVGDLTTRYNCNYVKKGDTWLIAELNEAALPPADAGTVALEELSWMVGSWKDNVPGLSVATTTEWTKNKHFLRRSVTVTREEGDPLDATEVIGYDPVAGKIRSWVFDSEGGFGEGAWRRDGDKWIISFKATAPDGTTSSAQQVLTYLDANKYTWESISRQSQGETLPNLDKVEIIRTKAE